MEQEGKSLFNAITMTMESPTLQTLHLEATPSSPLIVFNAVAGHCLLEGRAMPTDPNEFFAPIFKWIDSYAEAPNETTQFIIRIDYFNSGASLLLVRLVQRLNRVQGAKIYWHFHPDDETILEAGQLCARFAEIPFLFVPEEEV